MTSIVGFLVRLCLTAAQHPVLVAFTAGVALGAIVS